MKMTYDQFNDLIQFTRAHSRESDALYQHGIDLSKYDESWSRIVNVCFEALFTKDQQDTISWWLYDTPEGIEKDPEENLMWEFTDGPDGTKVSKEIPMKTVQDLYNYLASGSISPVTPIQINIEE